MSTVLKYSDNGAELRVHIYIYNVEVLTTSAFL